MKGAGKRSGLFDADGALQRALFDARAWSVLESTVSWLREVGRSLFLPIDIIVVLLRGGHDELGEQLARASRGSGGSADILPELEALARKVDRETEGEPKLHANNFSLGFTGILDDALNWAREAGWERVSEADLVRVVRWRAEVQESASVRWAIRQLAAPGGERLFDNDGVLKATAFVDSIWRSLQESMQLAARNGMPFLGTPHVVAVLCSTRESILWRAAEASGVDPRKLREELLRIVGVRSPAQSFFVLSRRTMTPRLVRMLTYAADRGAKTAGTGRFGEAQLIEGFLGDGGSSLELVKALGLENEIRNLLGDPKVLEGAPLHVEDREEPAGNVSSTPMLDLLGRDLTREAKEGRLPTVLGRERELMRIINVLLRREQRNPLLTGDAGVGKTALAAALASRIHDGRVPRRLQGYRVVEINGASLIGGTSYRGDLEARIKALLAEAKEKVILFVDEAHAVFAPRSGSGQPAEVPNHFKAALANGDVAVVAATTDAEYHRWIEQDPALKRRFERIEIPEPSEALTRTILDSLVGVFETDYEVTILPEAIEGALDLSVRFLPEQRLPDKAKKLLMDASIATSIDAASTTSNDTRQIRVLDRPVVTRSAVAHQLALKTGLPLDRLIRGETGWWVGLGDRLVPCVPGQENAVEQISRALVSGRLRSGLASGPSGIFVFLGPPGVGKSSLAKALAREIYADVRAVIKLNMSDFQESHSISRLIGSPPGYVGYQDEDALVTPLRRRPSSVVLLEDFDRAHPRVQDRFFSLFDEGTINDTRGMTADARHALFILTVNTAVGEEGSRIGFATVDDHEPQQRVRRAFEQQAPELAKRLRGYPHHVILFRSASSESGTLLGALLEQRLAGLRANLMESYGLRLVLAPSLEADLKREAALLKDARDLEPLIANKIVDPITNRLMKGIVGDTIMLDGTSRESGEFEAVVVAGEVSEEQTVTPAPPETIPSRD